MKNKKKIGIAALTSILSVVIIGGTLVPVYASHQEFRACEYCQQVFSKENIETHKNDCLNNSENIYGQCTYCGAKIETKMDVYYYGNLAYHERTCKENPNRIKGTADDHSKEDIVIDFWIPVDCEKCGAELNTREESENHVCPNTVGIEDGIVPLADDHSKEDIPIDTWIPVECEECGAELNTREEFESHVCPEKPTEPEETEKPVEPTEPIIITTKEHDNNAKETVMLVFRLPDNSKDDTEITTPTVDIAALEAEVIEAERIAEEARTEADRLTTIANEKRAALEAARQ